MKTVKEGELLGTCTTCKDNIHDVKFKGRPSEFKTWWHAFSIVFNGKWLCGKCLSSLSQRAREAEQAFIKYKKSKPTREHMQKKYGVYVNPVTGKIESVDIEKWSKL